MQTNNSRKKKSRRRRTLNDPLKRLAAWGGRIEIYYMMDNQSSDYPYNYDRLHGSYYCLKRRVAPLSGLIRERRSPTAARPQNAINRRQNEVGNFLTDSYSFLATHKRANKCGRYCAGSIEERSASASPFFSHWRQHYWRHMELICRMIR